jgi:hypothetical protein
VLLSNKGILNDWMASRLVESTDFNVAAASSLDIVSFSLFIVSVPIIYINEITLPLTFHYGKPQLSITESYGLFLYGLYTNCESQ